MTRIDFYKDTRLWHKTSSEHAIKNLGKMFKVTNCTWEPGNQYMGKIGKCIDTSISPSNGNVKFIELDTCPNAAFTLDELTEI